MQKIFEEVSLDSLSEIVELILTFGENVDVWKFEGDLGAGKTTIIKEICKQLGVTHVVQSPTFSIVNTYDTIKGELIYHFDCYRLKNKEEALDFGMEEYLDSGNLCLIEWPQIIEEYLPRPMLFIEIEIQNSRNRRIKVKKIL